MDTQMSPIDNSSSQMIQNEERYLATSKFRSFDELLTSVREFYYNKGYGLSIRNSRKDKFVILQCDRGGSYRDIRHIRNKREKSARSRLTNCPFRIVGKTGRDGAWVFKVKDLTHNHEPATDMSQHSSFRRLPPNNIQRVKEMTQSGIPPRQILDSLRQQTPNIWATSRTIYNLKAKIRKDSLGDRSMINSLFAELEKGGFLYDVLHNPKGDISGFGFLERDDEESYIWALSAFKKIFGQGVYPFVIMSCRELALLNAIKDVFPTATSLLSVWDIKKNMLANCKKYFGHEEFDTFMSSWDNVVDSATESLFEKNWGEFELFYRDKKDAMEYIKNTWLPLKEKFVSAWTEKYLHFGNRLSSSAESAHDKFKQYLQVSTGGFQEVREKICLAIENEFNEVKIKLESERIQVPHNCNVPLFREVRSYASHFALEEIYKQYEKIKEGIMTPCTGHFIATMGLPCAHKVQHLHEMIVSLELIHPHWRIDKLSLNSEDGLQNDDSNDFLKLLNELNSNYQAWPLHQKEYARSMISKLINQSDSCS